MIRLAVLAILLLVSACASQPAPKSYQDLVRVISDEGKLDVTPQSVRRVRFIVARLSGAVVKQYPKMEGTAWESHVAHYSDVNAWSWSEAKIIVMQGLISLGLSDDELAMAVAHEMAHVIKGDGDAIMALNRTQLPSVHSRFNRQQIEIEADRLGLQLATAAGYKREAMASMLKKMRDGQTRIVANENSSYPSWQERIQNAEAVR